MERRNHDDIDRVAALTEIWREVLVNPGLDEDSDLFEHGGTSLHVLQIAGRIYDDLDLNVKLRDIFTHASPRSLLACLPAVEADVANRR